MKRALLAAVLVTSFLACEQKTGGNGLSAAPIELPKVFGTKPLDKQDRITVELTAKGVVRVEGRRVSLDGLTETLIKERRTRGTHRTWNIIGTRRHKAGTASDLYVLLRADRRAPWQHALFLFTILMEEKVNRLQFAVEGGRIDATMPVDIAICYIEGQEPIETVINVDVLAGDSPTFRVGDHETGDAAEAIAAIKTKLKNKRASLRGQDVGFVGQVRAARTAHLSAVIDMYARMRTCGFTTVTFFGTVLPSRELRELSSLPRPDDPGMAPWEDYWDEAAD